MKPQILQVDGKLMQEDEVLSLLHRYQLTPHQLTPEVLRDIIIEQAIANFSCTEAEQQTALEEFCQRQQLKSPEIRDNWLQKQGMTLEQIQKLAIRPLQLEKFKAANWGHRIESYFLTRKSSFDRVTYSLIRTKDKELAQELFFRIQEGEQSFAELARQYSRGPEADAGGLLGPVPLTQPHPAISKCLSISQPGQLWSPRPVAEWFVIIRLEEIFPAKLNDLMRRRLLDELFETWLQEHIHQIRNATEVVAG